MSIILVGYRGSGKTTIGKHLAERLGWPYVDLDDWTLRQAGAGSGRSIKEIFQEHGEEYFRDLETAALREVARLSDHVIGLGGGALGREENRRLLKEGGHVMVYLRCEPEELLRRIRSDPQTAANRPNLSSLGGGIEEIRVLLAQREPIYRQVMDHELDTTRLSPQEAARQIAQMIS